MRFDHLSSAFFLLLLATDASAQFVAPIGGWRQGNPDAPYTQGVHYPASTPGLAEDTPLSSQIRGRIQKQQKAPATLVVNGNAMPLRLDESGAFARPYSFSPGSNSVEVISDGERQRVQFYEQASGQAVARLRIVLSWDTDATDLDLHVMTPSGQHAWYGQRVIPGGAIDIDVTTGYGPEIFASPAPEKGVYQVFVNYYGGPDSDFLHRRALTTARLTIVTGEGTASEKRQELVAPMRFPGELTRIGQFVHP
jgi:uncharacterized protein YfaP (DUF2135 family)